MRPRHGVRSFTRPGTAQVGAMMIASLSSAVADAQALPVITPATTERAREEDRPGAAAPTWSVVRIGDDRVGHGRYDERTLPDGTLRCRQHTELAVRRFGQTLEVATTLVTHETADGRLLGFDLATSNPPGKTATLSGVVANGALTLTSTVNGSPETTAAPLEAAARSPLWQDRVLRRIPLERGRVETFRAYVPDLKAVSDVRVVVGPETERTLADGTRKRLRAVDVTQSLLKQFPVRSFVDSDGDVWASETPFFGQRMRTDRVAAEFALAEGGGGTFDIGTDTLIDVRPLPDPHRLRRIVYRVSFDSPFAGDLPPETDRQKVRPIDETSFEITVTADDRVPRPRDRSRPAVGREYLAETQLLQADDFRVRTHAERAAGFDRDPGRVADAMAAYVGRELTEKNFSTAMASAAEVADTLAGDCTEHAVLLAAMLRARRIPSRVAVGFVYLPRRGKLGGHMWTEAFVEGRWRPLDATLRGKPVGPGHIKLADSALSDDAAALTLFLPVLDWAGSANVDVTTAE